LKSEFLPKNKAVLVFPLLFGIAPVLSVLGNNLGQINLLEGLRPLVFTTLAAVLMLLLFRWIFRDWEKSAFAVALLEILFYSYGHLYNYFHYNTVFGVIIGRHRTMLPLWGLIIVLGLWWIARRKKDKSGLVSVFNVVGLALLVFPLYQLAAYTFENISSSMEQDLIFVPPVLQTPAQKPDIYYIILDSYGRDDILKTKFDYDNAEFLQELEGLGFYVARCSQSNYNETGLSLVSSLNLNYLDQLGTHSIKSNKELTAIMYDIRNSLLQKALRGIGYQTVAFETGFYWSQVENADRYLSYHPGLQELIRPTAFESIFIKTTAGIVEDDFQIFIDRFNHPAQSHINRQLFMLEQLPKQPEQPGPKFVFAHITIPHSPYAFTPTGVRTTDFKKNTIEVLRDEPLHKKQYSDQVKFINTQMLSIVKTILAKSKTPPVIIIQGDHGPELKGSSGNSFVRTHAILNAYYLPGSENKGLYPSISPVNTFRVVLNDYFGTKLEQLPEHSFDKTLVINSIVIPREGCVQGQ
jgi:hypothetical protein